jgi:GWxTD domain-containing protein
MNTTTIFARGGLMLLSLALFGTLSSAIAQPLFTLDAASFNNEGQIYLEVYLTIQRSGLKFIQVDSGYQAPVDVTLELRSPDSLLSTTPWSFVDKAKTLDEITPKQKLPDISIFPQLEPGKYILVGHVRDVNRDTTYTRSLSLDLEPYSKTDLAFSDIELATQLEKTEAKNKFCKNGFMVIPNPEHLYGMSLTMLYYYTEIYNLKGEGGEFTVDRVILDDQGKEVKKLPPKTRKKIGSSLVEVDGIPVASLRSGVYNLKLTVNDQSAAASTQTRFIVFRPEDFTKPIAGGGDDASIMAYDQQQLDEALDGIKYWLSDGEWRSLETLTLDGKRRFLINFWAKNDPDPSTSVNEFKQTHEARMKVANERYTYLKRDGWRTDRGRVFMLHGLPDHIEVHSHDMQTRPYEIWNFDTIEGGVIFVFVDHNNFGDYRLVHSTKSGEISRSTWFEEEASIRK